jgi:hypothetical protein
MGDQSFDLPNNDHLLQIKFNLKIKIDGHPTKRMIKSGALGSVEWKISLMYNCD